MQAGMSDEIRVNIGEKSGNKTKVFANGTFIGALYPAEIRRYLLEDGCEISEEVYDEIMTDVLLHRAKVRLMNILIKSDRTEAELRKKLKDNLYCDETADRAIEYVRSFHYIDDLRTAESYIRSKIGSMSEREIRYNLENKGISREMADMAYENVLESGENEDSEACAAENFLRKKLGNRLLSGDEIPEDELHRIYAAAYRKGFRQESIRCALKRLINES